jgi:hypothetical protein
MNQFKNHINDKRVVSQARKLTRQRRQHIPEHGFNFSVLGARVKSRKLVHETANRFILYTIGERG